MPQKKQHHNPNKKQLSILTKHAQDSLNHIPEEETERIISVLEELQHKPHLGTILTGNLSYLRSYRVWPYRIIYQEVDDTIIVFAIGSRKQNTQQKRHKKESFTLWTQLV